jgi:hypothetical protein
MMEAVKGDLYFLDGMKKTFGYISPEEDKLKMIDEIKKKHDKFKL